MTIQQTTDAKLTKTDGPVQGHWDFTLDSSGDIATEDFFDTSLLYSIFGERRASESEVLESQRRRGWIGNESTPGFENGSKIWLFEQSRIDRDTLNGIQTAAQDGLKWLIEDGLAISTTSIATLQNGRVVLQIVVERPNSKVERRFFTLWENSGVTSSEE